MVDKFFCIIIPLYIIYIISFFLYYIYGYIYFCIDNHIFITILDNINFSYIEYISDISFISPGKEEEYKNYTNTEKSKLLLGIYKKGIFCECYNNQTKSIIIKDINICNFFGCDLKFDKSNEFNNSIYKWKNNSIYIEKSKYYFYQGINPLTNKCDDKLGFISCGFYDIISSEICVKKELNNCPYNNIIFNELNLYISLLNKNNINITTNISLKDIIPYIKSKPKSNKDNNISLFNQSLKEFLKENDIYSNYLYDNDKIEIIPSYNNITKYNKTISNNNFFTENMNLTLQK